MIEILKEILSDIMGSITLRSEVVETMTRELEERGLLTDEEADWVRQEIEEKRTRIKIHLGERLSLLEGMFSEMRSGLGFADRLELERLTNKVGSIEEKLAKLEMAIRNGAVLRPDTEADV